VGEGKIFVVGRQNVLAGSPEAFIVMRMAERSMP